MGTVARDTIVYHPLSGTVRPQAEGSVRLDMPPSTSQTPKTSGVTTAHVRWMVHFPELATANFGRLVSRTQGRRLLEGLLLVHGRRLGLASPVIPLVNDHSVSGLESRESPLTTLQGTVPGMSDLHIDQTKDYARTKDREECRQDSK